ncbi:MAG: anaerobic ribonucleoside-triphosphate reductase [Archaeoglobales archaeon]|nr:MAG: anaerobic ribonucleoside-triphosphate reductase [Archaeoglobales archaeon]
MKSIREYEETYSNLSSEWIKENANVPRSYSAFVDYVFKNEVVTRRQLLEYFDAHEVKAHLEGDLHIHKLPQSLWNPYCTGWDYGLILKKGIVGTVPSAKPAKYLSTAVAHLVHFFLILCQEWTGAQAVTGVDLYLAPFVNKDKLDFNRVRKEIETLVFDLNYPYRRDFQSPFTNITLVMDQIEYFNQKPAIIAGRELDDQLSDFMDECIILNKAFIDVFMEGDGLSRPFTFPILTIPITKKFDWNERRWDDLTYRIFELISRRGSIYIFNGVKYNAEEVFSMCCRLLLNRTVRGIWSIPDNIGSINCVTINLPRIGMISNDEDKFFEVLDQKLELARSILMKLRKRYEEIMRNGSMMILTQNYLECGLSNHFNTIGVVGLPEAASILMNNLDVWTECKDRDIRDAIEIMKRILIFINERLKEFSKADGYKYNLEEVPAESTAYRFAKLDEEKYPLFRHYIPYYNNYPLYSNSIIPYSADLSLIERIKYESEVQKFFTGGVILHIFLNSLADVEALKKLTYRIVHQTDLVYFSFTPVISVCPKCKRSFTAHLERCPECGGSVEVWSRIVGYYRPINRWLPARVSEFKARTHYSI